MFFFFFNLYIYVKHGLIGVSSANLLIFMISVFNIQAFSVVNSLDAQDILRKEMLFLYELGLHNIGKKKM